MDLVKRSVEIIRQGQSSTGAYIASPSFSDYRYSWFRDGAFIAYAMDLMGEVDSAHRFHQWAYRTLHQKRDIMERTIWKKSHGEELGPEDFLHTRYTLDGQAANEDWPNHQLDGFGTWLWALGEHQRFSRETLPSGWQETIVKMADYLIALWQQPCYDCWEEFPYEIHPYTLASIYAGLQSSQNLTGTDHSSTLRAIKKFVDENAVPQGYFVKFLGSPLVDSSLLGLCVPYGLVAPDDPRMQATVAHINADLYNGAGIKRYTKDTYYGGGDWVLLAAWKGWFDALCGNRVKAETLRTWIESTADSAGHLPEQDKVFLNSPSYYQIWVEQRGEIAQPLLWSHAMYLILVNVLKGS